MPSTSSISQRCKDVDARDKRGHDGGKAPSLRHGRAKSRPSTSLDLAQLQDVDARDPAFARFASYGEFAEVGQARLPMPSTSSISQRCKDVDARDKRGHDGE